MYFNHLNHGLRRCVAKECASINTQELEKLPKLAGAIRDLTQFALLEAGSGHSGLPLGCAEIGAYLYGEFFRFSPSVPDWYGRDRFVLSAGHGSLLIYTILHLFDMGVSRDDLSSYRQFDSITPSHPDIRKTPYVEVTSGLDGQGVSIGVGLSLGLKINESRFGKEAGGLFDAKVVVLAGDGCLMEGVSAEGSSLAGHLNLNNLILIYDCNNTSLDGYVDEVFSEDIAQRYKSYGWDCYTVDGNSFQELHDVLFKLRSRQSRPVIIIAKTIIGLGIEKTQGTPDAHGYPLFSNLNRGAQTPFFELEGFIEKRKQALMREKKSWDEQFLEWRQGHPDLASGFLSSSPEKLDEHFFEFVGPSSISGREASGRLLNRLAAKIPAIYSGSADLSKSDKTFLHGMGTLKKGDFTGRNIKYGVREFGMGAIGIGLALVGKIIPVLGTFLAFSDYMLSSIRMASLMQQKVIFHFSHDSFFIGHDGPTHQPVEQLSTLRGIPELYVLRPADANEVAHAWRLAIERKGPTALVLSRQDCQTLVQTRLKYEDGLGKGAYILEEDDEKVDVTLIATGSEVELALEVASELRRASQKVRVVSMPCQELFDQQSQQYKEKILGKTAKRVSIEAAIGMGWYKYVGDNGIVISAEEFGESGSPKDMATFYGFDKDKILNKIFQC